jgi:hypothetical protein
MFKKLYNNLKKFSLIFITITASLFLFNLCLELISTADSITNIVGWFGLGVLILTLITLSLNFFEGYLKTINKENK